MTCRDEILQCVAEVIEKTGQNEFTIESIVQAMAIRGSKFKSSTIRTHITSRMCSNAPQNHAVKYQDMERIGDGVYRLIM